MRDAQSARRDFCRMAGGACVASAPAAGFAEPPDDPGGRSPASMSVKFHGAKGDGKTDDTAAFQRALDDAAAAGGGTVFVPAGTYRIERHLTVPPGTALVGIGRAPQSYSPRQPGSMLLAVEGAGKPGGEPFLTLAGPNSTLEGISILYPDQKMENPPVPYPWTIRGGGGENVSILNVLLVNPYQAVDFGTKPSARHFIRGLYGQPLYRGIWVDQCYDIGRIQNVHFWPFWAQEAQEKTQAKKIVDYTTAHGVTFIFQRTDWEVVSDIFVWGYQTGVELSASKDGGMNGQMSNVNLDNVDIGLDVRETQPYAIHVSNLNIANAGAGERHIGVWGRMGAKQAELSIRGASFWGAIHQALRWDVPGTVAMADSRVVEWTARQPAVELLQGRAVLHDVTFAGLRDRTGVAIHLGKGLGGGLIHDNMLNGSTLVNQAASPVSVTNNLP